MDNLSEHDPRKPTANGWDFTPRWEMDPRNQPDEIRFAWLEPALIAFLVLLAVLAVPFALWLASL